MSGFTILYTTKADGLVEINGSYVKYWESTGLPTFESDMDAFAETYPQIVAEMVKRGILRKV